MKNKIRTHARTHALLTIDVAKARRLTLLGVMQSPGPVDGNVRLLLAQLDCTVHTGTRVELTKLVQTVKDGAVGGVSGVEALHGGGVLSTVVGCNFGKKLNVIFRMKLCHFARRGWMGTVAIHLLVESVAQNEMVCELEAVWFHWMGGPIVKEWLWGVRINKRRKSMSQINAAARIIERIQATPDAVAQRASTTTARDKQTERQCDNDRAAIGKQRTQEGW